MTFVEAVNRILRSAGILAGDDVDLGDFSGTQHTNFSLKAQIAVQDELADLFADKVFPYEQTQGFITLVSGTRTYSLDSNFIRFLDQKPFLLEVDAATSTGTSLNNQLFEWPGGEENLRHQILDYRDTQGAPGWFYRVGGTSNQIGIYPVPDGSSNNEIYRYEFERTRTVSVSSDTLPFISTEAANAFVEAASRRFQYMRLTPQEQKALFPEGINQDPQIQQARSKVFEFSKITQHANSYGRWYE